MASAITHSESDSALDLGDLFRSVVASVASIIDPSPAAVRAAGNELFQFVWGIAIPLLESPSGEVFELHLDAFATAKTMRQFERLTSHRAAKKFLEEASQREKVRALKPAHESGDPLAIELKADIDQRMDLILPHIRAAANRAGFRAPKRALLDPLDARVVVSLVPICVAAAVQQRYPATNIERAWAVCTASLIDTARIYGVGAERCITARDNRLADEGENRARSEEAERAAERAAIRAMDEDAFWFASN